MRLGGTATLMLLLCGCHRVPPADASLPADPKWRTDLFTGFEPLTNVPLVTPSTNADSVTVSNQGTTTLSYFSAGRHGVQLFQELDISGRWEMHNWDWCGTGKERFELPPGESVELVVKFWEEGKRERMLAHFIEKETLRGGMIPLLAEP